MLKGSTLILVFAGSLFCRTWIYTQSRLDTPLLHKTASIHSEQISQKSAGPSCELNRPFKSKKRIEKYGVIQQDLPKPFPSLFYSTVTELKFKENLKPTPREIFVLRQPPRFSSII